MDATSFTALHPRPVSGWPLRALCDLDVASPHFHSHVLTASALKRQSIFAAVSEWKRDPHAITAALGAASGIRCRDPFAQAAQSLVVLKPNQILRAIYGHIPDALLGTLKRAGPDPFTRRGLYRDLFSVFHEPDQRDRADIIRQFPSKLTEERLEIALTLDLALLHQRAFAHVTDLDEAEQVNTAVRLIRATVSSATTDELRGSLAVLPQGVELSAWAAQWLRKLDRPLVAPPKLNDPDLIVLGVQDLRAASLQLRNCLHEKLIHVISGRDAYVVLRPQRAVAELRLVADSQWVVAQIWGPSNEHPDQSVEDELRRKLGDVGIFSLAAAIPATDLELLAEFFGANDLLGWRFPRRARHPLHAIQEAV